MTHSPNPALWPAPSGEVGFADQADWWVARVDHLRIDMGYSLANAVFDLLCAEVSAVDAQIADHCFARMWMDAIGTCPADEAACDRQIALLRSVQRDLLSRISLVAPTTPTTHHH